MTQDNEKPLLRKPRAPKLQKIDLSRVRYETPPNTQLPESGRSSTFSMGLYGNHERTGSANSDFISQSPNKNTPNTMQSVKFQEMIEIFNINQLAADAHLNYLRMHDAYDKNNEGLSYTSFDQSQDANPHFKAFKQLSAASSLIQKAALIRQIPIDPQQRDAYLALREYSQIKNFKNIGMMRPYKTLGPDPLPARYPKQFEDKKQHYQDLSYDINEIDQNNQNNNKFSLNDLLIENSENCHKNDVPGKPIISTHNYKQICKRLQDKIHEEQSKNSEKVHVTTLVPQINDFEHRIPLKQIVIEMASFLKQELSQKIGIKLKAKFNPLPKWQKLQGAHTEILVYEDENERKIDAQKEEEERESQNQITPAHLAVLDALIRNGLALSLKAHFIDKLPDLSTLDKTLIYLNLSFNTFRAIPAEVFSMMQLEALKLRNNPIITIPYELCYLQNLKILILSYCQIDSELPECIYSLVNLKHLDVSYNTIKYLSRLISNMRSLKYLNLEGNELEYLPASTLQLNNLEKVNVKNNYMHPLIWSGLNKPKVQRLTDIAKLCVYTLYYVDTNAIQSELDNTVEALLQDIDMCDQCGGPRFGSGLKSIRPCEKAFGVKYLPFIFECCSQQCFNAYKKKQSKPATPYM